MLVLYLRFPRYNDTGVERKRLPACLRCGDQRRSRCARLFRFSEGRDRIFGRQRQLAADVGDCVVRRLADSRPFSQHLRRGTCHSRQLVYVWRNRVIARNCGSYFTTGLPLLRLISATYLPLFFSTTRRSHLFILLWSAISPGSVSFGE